MRTPGTVTMLAVLMLLGGCAVEPAAPARPAPTEPWAWELTHCPGYQPGSYPAAAHRVAAQVEADSEVVVQVDSYQPGWGAVAFAEVESVLGACGHYEHGDSGDPAAYLEQHRIVDRELAGDESLLAETVRLRPPEAQSWCVTVVRAGDRLATVRRVRTAGDTGPCPPAVGAAWAALHAAASPSSRPGR